MGEKRQIAPMIEAGHTALGVELGSTRIKAVLIGADRVPLASASHDWENRLDGGIWTYSTDAVWAGLRDVYGKLTAAVEREYGVSLRTAGSAGVSAMMHGYLPFDAAGNQLAPFRTWRNTVTERAAAELTEKFRFNIPQRWSVSHLYRAILEKEPHVNEIGFLTTLAGYVHWKLTGEKALGVGDASGMFPVDPKTGDYHREMLATFGREAERRGIGWKLEDILPRVMSAGERAGSLTGEGAKLLDPTGRLEAGIPFCPPEGDAGTGMTATNAVAPQTGNVSAGTSIFAMLVLEQPLSGVYEEIDIVATPAGKPAAMVHCNNCTSDLDAWINLFGQLLSAMGASYKKPDLYDAVYLAALEGAADAGGLLNYNYYSGEPIVRMDEGRPLFVRMPDSVLCLPDFARSLLYSAMATLRIGMDLLTGREGVKAKRMQGHGGLFKTPRAGQTLMADALNIPVSVMESAGEGGAWGIALLADYMRQKRKGESLERYLEERVFAGAAEATAVPDPGGAEGFDRYLARYNKGLAIERAAVEHMKQKTDERGEREP